MELEVEVHYTSGDGATAVQQEMDLLDIDCRVHQALSPIHGVVGSFAVQTGPTYRTVARKPLPSTTLPPMGGSFATWLLSGSMGVC